MTFTRDEARRAFLHWLEAETVRIADLEQKGVAVLGSDEAYTAVMREKAGVVAGLHEEGKPYWEALEKEDRAHAVPCLRAFSESAIQGLRLGSVFYMSALLFPEDHEPGEPNSLEALAGELRRRWQ